MFVMAVFGCMYPERTDTQANDTINTVAVMETMATETAIDIENNEPIIDDAEETLNDITTEIKTETTTEVEVETEVETEIEPLFYLSDYERWVVECIVMGESGIEPYDGQILVAQCVLNACLKDGLQPSEVRTEYKYSGWNENPSDDVKDAVSAVFDDGYTATDEFILYFYAPKYAEGKWHETQRFVIEVGGHRFFAEWDD